MDDIIIFFIIFFIFAGSVLGILYGICVTFCLIVIGIDFLIWKIRFYRCGYILRMHEYWRYFDHDTALKSMLEHYQGGHTSEEEE